MTTQVPHLQMQVSFSSFQSIYSSSNVYCRRCIHPRVCDSRAVDGLAQPHRADKNDEARLVQNEQGMQRFRWLWLQHALRDIRQLRTRALALARRKRWLRYCYRLWSRELGAGAHHNPCASSARGQLSAFARCPHHECLNVLEYVFSISQHSCQPQE